MKIFGVGTDMILVERIERSLKKSPERLLMRVLCEHERQIYYNRGERASYVATRFAAKEAFAKALGSGIGSVCGFKDLCVYNNEVGKPYFLPSERLRLYLSSHEVKCAHLSISDTSEHALAFVVLETSLEAT